MRKTYKAISDVSFTIAIGGGNKRISFQPVTSGGSVYTSNDVEEMKAIEAKDSFNVLFKCINTEEEEEKQNKGNGFVVVDKVGGLHEGELKDIKEIDNLADAREFLKENGAEGKDLRSKVVIIEVARSLGFIFPNI